MSRITLWACENCGEASGEHLGPYDLGDGPLMIDLCPACQAVVGIAALEEMLDEYGATTTSEPIATTSRTPGSNTLDCPICQTPVRGARVNIVRHIASVHDMPLVEASHIAKPSSKFGSVECPACGFLCGKGTGIAVHCMSIHGYRADSQTGQPLDSE